MKKVNIEPFLARVSKPTRYLGNEVNSIHKDVSKAEVKIAFAFPDVYEVGMSHLGLKILYQIVNDLDWAVAERVYTPWFDLEEVLKTQGLPLFSLESKTPLSEFDLIGFSLQYEMSYSNVLNMLDLSKIPLLSAQRTDQDPLIIAGGPCVFNPEPMADFIDLFCIGDGEEVIVEILQAYRANKGKKSRQEILEALAQIPGVYVPAFYDVSYHPSGTIKEIIPNKPNLPSQIQRRIIQDLDQAKFPFKQIVPFMDIVHDRAALEIQRGCTQGCRFCHAGMVCRPSRERSLATLVRQGKQAIAQTGYEEISLCSLSSTDYSGILRLVSTLDNSFGGQTAISLPSLRVDPLVPEISTLISKIHHTGLTLAPEAASPGLQQVINKQISEEELIAACKHAYQLGWNSVKLYFMVGLPTEADEDLEAIVQLVQKVKEVLRGRKQVKVSISAFVPKAHTPFQWELQIDREELRRRQNYIRDRLPRKGVSFSWHEPDLSFLEGVFSRGDRRLGKVLLAAWELGCKFDGWTDYLKFDLWLSAFAQTRVSAEFYANRKRDFEETLPWNHISTGVKKEFLIQECQKAYKKIPTPNCQQAGCYDCGLECKKIKKEEAVHYEVLRKPVKNTKGRNFRVRLKFTKGSEVMFISHLDLIRLFNRALKRAEIPVTMSEGFHPHQRVSFGHPLPVGTKSQAEFVDVDLTVPVKLDELQFKLNQVLPQGIKIITAFFISSSAKSLSASATLLQYRAKVAAEKGINWWQDRVEQLLAQQQVWVMRARQDRSKEIEVRQWVKEIKVSQSALDIEVGLWLRTAEQGTVKPIEIISWLSPEAQILDIERIEQFGQDGRVLIG